MSSYLWERWLRHQQRHGRFRIFRSTFQFRNNLLRSFRQVKQPKGSYHLHFNLDDHGPLTTVHLGRSHLHVIINVITLAICVVPEHSVFATFFWPSGGIKTSKDWSIFRLVQISETWCRDSIFVAEMYVDSFLSHSEKVKWGQMRSFVGNCKYWTERS